MPQVRGPEPGHAVRGNVRGLRAARRAGAAQRDMRAVHRDVPEQRRRDIRLFRPSVRGRGQHQPAVGAHTQLEHHGRRARVPVAARPVRADADQLPESHAQDVHKHIQTRRQPALVDHRPQRTDHPLQQAVQLFAVVGRLTHTNQ